MTDIQTALLAKLGSSEKSLVESLPDVSKEKVLQKLQEGFEIIRWDDDLVEMRKGYAHYHIMINTGEIKPLP